VSPACHVADAAIQSEYAARWFARMREILFLLALIPAIILEFTCVLIRYPLLYETYIFVRFVSWICSQL
jgi:hypothetical protein